MFETNVFLKHGECLKVCGPDVFEAEADLHFLRENELGRCKTGNMSLATKFQENIEKITLDATVTRITFTDIGVKVQYVIADGNGRNYFEEEANYLVLAVPPKKWSDIEFVGLKVDGNDWNRFNLPINPQIGQVLKVLFKLKNRFWMKNQSNSPNGSYESFLSWETTEWQGNDGEYCFVTFVGGCPLTKLRDEYRDDYGTDSKKFIDWTGDFLFKQIDGGSGLNKSDFVGSVVDVNFMDWSDIGYSCPSVGEITKIGEKLHSPWNGRRMWIAGEHACMYNNSGFMEGALFSGKRVAELIKKEVNQTEE